MLVSLLLPGRARDQDDPLSELYGLTTTAGACVVGTMLQKRQRPDAGTYLGHGKVEELTSLVQRTGADVVVFNNELSPGQIRNLEMATDTKVLDRTEVILDIFASRARTHEARLQVELAQLEYALPRLKRMWPHLSRMEGGIGMRGPGEQQLEEDRRIVDRRITDLRHKIEDIHARKQREVASRASEQTIAIVGYTNAGKSTLMNALTGAGVLVEDKLFATLDTRTRQWQLGRLGRVLLSDTVGFIRDLPHHLVASFRATLEEVRQANLLLHVVDGSSASARDQIAAVQAVLDELGCRDKPTIMVLNKTDAVRDRSYLDVLRAAYPNSVAISARCRSGLDRLERLAEETLCRQFVELDVATSASNGRLLAYLEAHAITDSRTYEGERVTVHCLVPRPCLGEIARLNNGWSDGNGHRASGS